MFQENEYLTVSELNQLIRDVINMGFPQSVWVCGEIQGYNRNRGKNHIFFELCEKDSTTKDIVARTGLVVFAGRKKYIEDVLKSAENAFALKDDIEVKFLCKVDFYPPHGALRLIVENIDPIYTLGKIAQEKQKLIALLKKSGTLDKNKAVELPLVPLNIGLITAFDSAAYNDFLHELQLSGFGFKVFYKSALMQGKGAEQAVCRAIEDLSKVKTLDAIVITRGGGSIADLSCFDSKMIAEKIAAAPLPVLSGIGHEINITVTDMAAHTYQKTPTAVAQFFVERVESFLAQAQDKVERIVELAQDQVAGDKGALKQVAVDLQNKTNLFLRDHHKKVVRVVEVLKRQPQNHLLRVSVDFGRQKDGFLKTVADRTKNARMKICHFERLVDMASPVNILKRGFSITRTKKGQIVRSVGDVKQKDQFLTQLVDGVLESEVFKINKEEKSG
ncbi:MAG: exodeoxyribonuclease VII large subunit [Candidatus Omnitrophica bacterium]|nr:exodeoxyribonuclease VII large subunit [Candidatus Omnitrophota bacterium]